MQYLAARDHLFSNISNIRAARTMRASRLYTTGQAGNMPCASLLSAAAAEARNVSRACAPSGCSQAVMRTAEKVVTI